MLTLMLPESLAKYIKTIPSELSSMLFEPNVQATLAQVVAGQSTSPLPDPPKMTATMMILEELERKSREVTKKLEEEVDDYIEHPEY